MGYKLFLDDLRSVNMVYKDLSDHDFIIVRSYLDFVNYISENGLPDFISFDNDLGEDELQCLLPDGYACAKWLVYDREFDLRNLKFNVHSANPVAKVQIESLLNNYQKFLKNEE
ncbi:cyclic-phosphate processing receiver domain-containing protein [Arcticibacter eurypsychrophilus]|uniref:cyclic-phosphate processing receiver domain-containing protein n=1 Tax=Arcticibacter eurypsychrophilus TaxID=1434752 RepID=UPI00084E0AF2|nr:cyclic-phosphate processing receiver domain-containing protein [Arcticibacter eurypsychrophilus]